MDDFSLGRIDKKGYRPTREAEDFLEQLRRTLVTGEKFRVARLAIAHSLATPGDAPLVPRGTEMGAPMEGQQLFGEDIGIWACLILERAALPVESVDVFRQLVEAHWMRGARLLKSEYDAVGGRDAEFAARLAFLAEPSESGGDLAVGDVHVAPIRILFGETGTDLRTQQPYTLTLNEPATSPHAFVVGSLPDRARALVALAGRVADAQVPLVMLDTGGMLVRHGVLVEGPDGQPVGYRLPRATVVDVMKEPLPLDLFAVSDRAAFGRLAGEGIARALRGREGTVEAVQAAIEVLPKNATLSDLPAALRASNERLGRKRDVVEGRLSELGELALLAPGLRPDRFWEQSWVIGLAGLSDDARRVMLALLAASALTYRREAGRAPEDNRGFWKLSQALVVVDGSEFFGMAVPAVGEMLTRGRALGLAVLGGIGSVLDLGPEGENVLGRVGTLASFAVPLPTARQLRDAFGKRLAPEQLGERELPPGVVLLRDGRREPVRVEVWR